jgi:SNF2 family DNA or RNA helicase
MRALCAERRWVMSGTPAKGTSVQLGLSSLYGLLSFVGHPVCADGGRQWRREYATPLERGADGGAARLRALLRGVMVRHTADAAAIPPPERTLVLLPCSAAERRAYNTVLSYVAANITLTALGAPPLVSLQVSIHACMNEERSSSTQVKRPSSSDARRLGSRPLAAQPRTQLPIGQVSVA